MLTDQIQNTGVKPNEARRATEIREVIFRSIERVGSTLQRTSLPNLRREAAEPRRQPRTPDTASKPADSQKQH